MWTPKLDLKKLSRELSKRLARDLMLESDMRNVQGIIAWTQGSPKALRLLEGALRQNPGSTSTHAALAQLHFDNGHWAKAGVHTQQALRSAPTNGLFHALLGAIAVEEERWEATDAHFGRALQHAPRDPAVLLLRAKAQAAAGDTEGARVSARDALAIAPGLIHATQLIEGLDPIALGE